MEELSELFQNKRQEIVCMTLYYELGELDFQRLIEMARYYPHVQRIVDHSFKVKGRRANLYLVPATAQKTTDELETLK